MIFKSPAPLMETEKLHLSVVDQRTPRVYTQTLLIFPFPDGNQAEAAVAALTNGLSETLKKFPFLAGTLSLRDDESGKLTLAYPSEIPDVQDSRLFVSKFISGDQFKYTYEQLKASGMPTDVFTPELFRADDLLNYPGIPFNGEGMVDFERSDAPVFRCQASFIPGGLVLFMCFHHTVMDCSGISNFWTYFANEITMGCHATRGQTPTAQVANMPPDQSQLRRDFDKLAPSPVADQCRSADAYTDETYIYDKTLADDAPCRAVHLVIPAMKMSDYRSQLKRHFPEDSPPSICNVLAALLWIHVTRARASRVGGCGCTTPSDGNAAIPGPHECQHKTTHIGIATDLRKRRDPQLTSEYMGNGALFSKGTLSIAAITAEDRVTEKTIVAVIREIRQTIQRANPQWVNSQLAFFKSIEQIGDTECALGFRFGRDIYVTSWMNFSADLQWNIPGTDLDEDSLNGRAEFIRRWHNASDGGMMIMPRRRTLVKGKEAPYEILIRLAQVDLDTLWKEEGGLRDWGEQLI